MSRTPAPLAFALLLAACGGAETTGAGPDDGPGENTNTNTNTGACAAPTGSTEVMPLTDVNGPPEATPTRYGDGDNLIREAAVAGASLIFNSQDGVHSVPLAGGAPALILKSRGTSLDTPAILTPFWLRAGDSEIVVRDDRGWRRKALSGGDPVDLASRGIGIYDRASDSIVTFDFVASGRRLTRTKLDGSAPAELRALDDAVTGVPFMRAGGGKLYYEVSMGGAEEWHRLTIEAPADDAVYAPALPGGATFKSVLFVDGDDVYASGTHPSDFSKSGIYRVRAGGAVQVVSSLIIGTPDAAAGANALVFGLGSDYYAVPKTASAPVAKWFSPSTYSSSCLSYGGAISGNTFYGSMLETSTKKTLIFRRDLP